MIVAAMDTEGEKTQVAVPLSRYFWDPLDSLPAGCPSASLGQGVMSYWFRSLSLARSDAAPDGLPEMVGLKV